VLFKSSLAQLEKIKQFPYATVNRTVKLVQHAHLIMQKENVKTYQESVMEINAVNSLE